MHVEVEALETDILMYRGARHESIATAFINGGDALLVDALADRAEAESLRMHLERDVGARVRYVFQTHAMNDHMAGLNAFPDAVVVAHRYHSYTYLAQRERLSQQDYRVPDVELDGEVSLDWGRHRLRIFNNPGKTLCMLNVDVPDADMVLCGDNLVGRTAYLSSSSPQMLEAGLLRLQQLGRSRVIGGHMGVLPGTAIAAANFYLRRLAAAVRETRLGADPATDIRRIRIQGCLAPGVQSTPFEREWHTRNLELVIERNLFLSRPPRRHDGGIHPQHPESA